MKRLFTFLLFAFCGLNLTFAQVTGVSTNPENKNAIIEEFTGVRCVNCPAGHTTLAGILSANPNDVFTTGLHPTNSSYTTPYSGDPDLRNGYNDAFYSTPYCGTSRFMPSAFINRREWSTGEKITSRSSWSSSATTIMSEASPMNVGVLAEYDSVAMELNITVEVYYTSTVTDQNSLYVMLNEDGIYTQQSGATGPYEQKHIMREGFCAQWGDAISTTTMGTMHTWTHTFSNVAKGYNMYRSDVVAYVENKANEEIYTGSGAEVTFKELVSNNQSIENLMGMAVYPNPFSEAATVALNLGKTQDVKMIVMDLTGRSLYSKDFGSLNAGQHKLELNSNEAGLSSGIYFVTVQAGEQQKTRKVIVE